MIFISRFWFHISIKLSSNPSNNLFLFFTIFSILLILFYNFPSSSTFYTSKLLCPFHMWITCSKLVITFFWIFFKTFEELASFVIAHGATLKLLNCFLHLFYLVKLMLGSISGNCYLNSMRTDCLHTNFILLKISTTLCVNFIVYTIPHIIGSLLSPSSIHYWMVL